MRYKYTLIAIVIIVLAGIGISVYRKSHGQPVGAPAATSGEPSMIATMATQSSQTTLSSPQKANQTITTPSLVLPLDRAKERVTKKPFGIYITKANSPVQPERFSGYHTGTDFETFSDEQDSVDVTFKAVCEGKLLVKRTASGYGGVLVQSCTLNNDAVTIVYGHIRLASVSHKVGDSIKAGERLGLLGTGFSSETDGERKHLHLGIYKGAAVNIAGYVQNKADLSGWLSALDYM